ncbi:hypothetical protein [Parasphingorhabdus sp.]|uniref:hypothetical protein n=1 Tax=Parasphingorhabdus sp. TaxID=2709688 RepID=UPI003002C569
MVPPPALPVPARKPRHDGWTEVRRKTFLAVLRESGCVADACRVVGISTTSAYRLRRRDADIAARWQAAQANARRGLVAVAHQHAVVGKETVIYRGGEEVERRVTPSDSMLALLIRRGDLAAEAAAEGAAQAEAASTMISWEEWQRGIRFDPDGRKSDVTAEQQRASASLAAKLEALRERMRGGGHRAVNIYTGEGIDQAVIDAVMRVAGDRARVVPGVEWDEGVDWEGALSGLRGE